MTESRTQFIYREARDLPRDQVIALYEANKWSAAKKPDLLLQALRQSHALVTGWKGDQLVGLGNSISDGCLVVYFPHLLVLPEFQGQGIGRELMRRLQSKYSGFHMQMLTADHQAIGFYQKFGFVRAGQTEPMWIYAGNDH